MQPVLRSVSQRLPSFPNTERRPSTQSLLEFVNPADLLCGSFGFKLNQDAAMNGDEGYVVSNKRLAESQHPWCLPIAMLRPQRRTTHGWLKLSATFLFAKRVS